jgi:hypothetical protein
VSYPLQGISIWLGINSFEPHFPEEEEEPLWCSRELDDRGVDVREGPAFFAASDGVRWWRDRGAEAIFVSLDLGSDNSRLWAGLGDAPVDPETGESMPVFVETDPRGIRDGAIASLRAAGEIFDRWCRDQEAEMDRTLGAQFTARRIAAGLSIDAVVERVGPTGQWLEDVESGATAREVTLPQWIDLVWATQEPWPDDRQDRLVLTWRSGYAPITYTRLSQTEDSVREACR